MLQPKWLALLALVIVVMYAFIRLGMWQMNAAQDRGRQEAQAAALARPTVPLDQVIGPHEAMTDEAAARMVTAAGRYDASRQILITGRQLEGRAGYWVITPLQTANGALLPVLRGFVDDPADANRPPATRVYLTGMFAPNEGPPDRRVALPADQLQKVDLGDLVNRWPEDLYNGFLFATAETPALSWGSGSAITPVPPPDAASTELNWRNLSYAAQWWVFAAFGAYMWWRMVREDARRAGLSGAVGPDRGVAGAVPHSRDSAAPPVGSPGSPGSSGSFVAPASPAASAASAAPVNTPTSRQEA